MSEGFSNAVVGGAETLIRTAIKSFGYIAGIFGWRIARDGTCEFNNGTFRGTVTAGGGAVTLNSTGLHVIGATKTYDVNTNGGFIARNLPNNGVETQMPPGGIFFTSQDPSPLGNAVDFGEIFVGYQNSGLSNETPFMTIGGNEYTGKAAPVILMVGQSADSAIDNSQVQVFGSETVFFQDILILGNSRCIDANDAGVTNGTTASTGFIVNTTGAGIHGCVFTAPPSGMVLISATCGAANNTALQYVLLDYQIRAGSTLNAGTIFRAADENTAGQHQSAVANHFGMLTSVGYVATLTPGQVYNACIAIRVTANTGTINRCKITVVPMSISP